MRYSFTATTTAQTVPGNLFIDENQAVQSITIGNAGDNPVFFTKYGVASSTDCLNIPSKLTFSTIITQAIPSYSFVTTGGNSIVVIETF